jgi:hypothetical protein
VSFSLHDLLLAVALAPYLWLAWKDNALHFKARKVPPLEHVTHVGVVLALVVGISAVFRRDIDHMLLGAAAFLPPALADEWLFHREIPAEEHDVHAKQHLMLFAFAILATLIVVSEQ